MPEDVRKRIEMLRRDIERHNRLYYVDASPQISDAEYDKLYAELVELETAHPELITPDSPTQRVGGEPLGEFPTVAHEVPMLSIDNTYSEAELREFDARTRRFLKTDEPIEYVVELKVDGVAATVIYENGMFALGATRGDGVTGDDVTANMRTIRAIPLRLEASGSWTVPTRLEARGEIYMETHELERLNAERKAAGKALFANSRNATAGTIKLRTPRLVAKRRLLAFFYGLGVYDGRPVEQQSQVLDMLGALGLPVNPERAVCRSIDEVLAFVAGWADKRHELLYLIDGLVIKVNSLKLQARLGRTAKAPRCMIAYKYPAEQAATRILDIRAQVGKTGVLTPVAHLERVLLAGTTVKRASLHNYDEIKRKDIRVGDKVVIEKAGEIIPQVVRVMPERNRQRSAPVVRPTKCPSCGGPLVQEAGEAYLVWEDAGSVRDLEDRVNYFRSVMGITGLGPNTVKKLVATKLVREVADLYSLTYDRLASISRAGSAHRRKSGGQGGTPAKILESIEKSKSCGLTRLLTALGIRHVAPSVAHALATKLRSLDAVMAATREELLSVEGVTSQAATSIARYFDDTATKRTVKKLKDAGVITEVAKGGTDERPPVEVYLRCDNLDCPAQLKERLVFFGSRNGMYIKGLGPSVVAQLVDRGLVHDPADLYSLTVKDIAVLERKVTTRSKKEAKETESPKLYQIKEKTGQKIVTSIQKSKGQGMARLLTALGIRHVGTAIASVLAEHFRSVDALRGASRDEIAKAIAASRVRGEETGGHASAEEQSGAGSKAIAASVVNFFSSAHNLKVIEKLKKAGVSMELAGADRGAGVLGGKTFVFTGTLESMGRTEAEDRVRSLGGKTGSSVTKATDFVVAGSGSGGKRDRAVSLGVRILSEAEFLTMIGTPAGARGSKAKDTLF